MKLGVIINQHAAHGRDESFAKDVHSGFAAHRIQVKIVFAHKKEIALAAQNLLRDGIDGLIAGGGDGTASTVAEYCVANKIPLGVLLLGTRNHFGRDLGLPTSMEESIACIATGHTFRIDVGAVNGRTFLNNSSIGAYPHAVEEREELRSRFGLRKHVAGCIATLRTFAQHPLVNAEIEIGGRKMHCAGPFVFVGNNVYTVRLFSVNLRSSLSEGRICVYTTRANGVTGLFRMLWLSLFNRLEQSRDFEMLCGTEAVIHLEKKSVKVSKDGEILRLNTPLRYVVLPKALQVFAPSPAT